MPEPSDLSRKIGDVAAEAGLRRIHVLAWRDLADVEAGGSELHAAMIAKHWAEAGLEVTMRTSWAQGSPPLATRDGYRVIRKAGRYLVFPRAVASELVGRHGPRDGLVEIWNGVPFFSPLWATGPRMVFLHHLHEHMWPLVLSPGLARFGEVLERELAPRLYRRSPIVTLSESSKRQLVEKAKLPEHTITVVPPGIDARFEPGGERSPRPVVVAVGRLMASKYFDVLIRQCARARQDVPDLELVIVGEGYEHDALTSLVAELDAAAWVRLAGRVSDDDLVALYQSAWVVASASLAEGWGMTLTEAAACGTPAVATDITGHADAVARDRSGLLVAGHDDLAPALTRVLTDDALRQRLQAGALEHAGRFTWERTALGALEVLAADAQRRQRHRR